MGEIIGRNAEQKRLKELYNSKEAEFIAIYGRRRVGKTYLVTELFRGNCIYFELTGQYKSSYTNQLGNFLSALQTTFPSQNNNVRPKGWSEAFEMLKNNLEACGNKKRMVLFFDELPWLASQKSGFLSALDHFWNTWASRNNYCKVIVCGSAASWIIKNIVNSKGGLHNRLTASIRLMPFTIRETRDYLNYRGIHLNNQQILEIYMVIGGIPHYLKQIRKGYSAAQNINDLCFRKDGVLVDEFDRLFDSLFNDSPNHKKVVVALAKARGGLKRQDLLNKISSHSGGALNRILTNLEEAGFIMKQRPFGKVNREAVFRLIDEYCRFYVSWISGTAKHILTDDKSIYWQQQVSQQRWKSWAGLAFEDVCFKHIRSIKKALGISGISTTESAWYRKGISKKDGAQIDLLIDRTDNCITVCEMKYYNSPIRFNKNEANSLKNKVSLR